jgi:hypothetical protein
MADTGVVDFLLDAADRAMAELRRRHPRVMLAVALGVWLPVLAFLVALTVVGGVWPLVVLASVPTVALAVTVAMRGLRRTWSSVWVAGTGTILIVSGAAVQWWIAPDELHGAVITLGSFIYAQVYLGLLNALDHHWVARHTATESVEEARFRLRRMLQFRLLLATLIVVFGATSSRNDSYPQIMPWDVLFGLCCMPILVAAWVRLRPLAWLAAGTIALLALANILAIDDAARQRTLLELGWVQLVAIYLWIKAARVWYWPIPDRLPPPKAPETTSR